MSLPCNLKFKKQWPVDKVNSKQKLLMDKEEIPRKIANR